MLCDYAGDNMQIDIDEYKGPGAWLRVIPKRAAGLGIVTGVTLACGGTEMAMENKWCVGKCAQGE